MVVLCAALSAACAGAQRPADGLTDASELREFKGQLAAQSALVADQQRRIEELEVRLGALTARAQGAAAHAQPAAPPPPAGPAQPALPGQKDPRPGLKTIKLGGEGRRLRRDRNPVERAPLLPATIGLREPDEADLAALAEPVRYSPDSSARAAASADHAWALAVQKLNGGDHAGAEVDLLAFADAHPHHTAADNALFLVGLIRATHGDCLAALPLFTRVPFSYPAGDAVPPALLEQGRCLLQLDRRAEAKAVLTQLGREHPDAPEARSAQQLLNGL